MVGGTLGGVPPTVVYQIRTQFDRHPVTGVDSCLTEVPPAVYTKRDGGPPVVRVAALRRVISQLSFAAAVQIGARLHHADWVITSDPAEVERIGMHGDPGCVSCRAGVDQVLAGLGHRYVEVLAGNLYWAPREVPQ